MQEQLGATEFAQFAHALQQPAPVSIRLNPDKLKLRPNLDPVPWASQGYYLPSRPVFTLDPLLHAGAYYVQEASSMFLEQALLQAADLSYPLRVLDLCGAPGGKSTHMASLLPPECLLVSNEVIRSRAHILAENLQKWGNANVVVTNNDPRDFSRLPHFFDVLVIDAPCSGEGLFRKDPAATEEWSENNVKLCAERQRRILMDVWDCLRPGGLLIYSTCTYNSEENEQNLLWLAAQEAVEPVQLKLVPEWDVVEKQAGPFTGYQFYPNRVRGEGLFMTVLRKAGDGVAAPVKMPKKPKLAFSTRQENELWKNWVTEPDSFTAVKLKEKQLNLFPQAWLPELELLYQQLHFQHFGIEALELVKKEAKPLHGMALSQHLRTETFTVAELALDQALRFLQKEDIAVPKIVTGWVLVQYKGMPLGWLKNMGNRTNNYYPKEWRIRMDIQQADAETNFAPLASWPDR